LNRPREVKILREIALLKVINLSLANENSSGLAEERICPFQESLQRRTVDPSATLTCANNLEVSSRLSKSLHQKEPLIFSPGSDASL
jgi:hypothetical protein